MFYSKRGEEEWDKIQEENQKRWMKEYELKKKKPKPNKELLQESIR